MLFLLFSGPVCELGGAGNSLLFFVGVIFCRVTQRSVGELWVSLTPRPRNFPPDLDGKRRCQAAHREVPAEWKNLSVQLAVCTGGQVLATVALAFKGCHWVALLSRPLAEHEWAL